MGELFVSGGVRAAMSWFSLVSPARCRLPLALAASLLATSLSAQAAADTQVGAAAVAQMKIGALRLPANAAVVPFAVGEKLDYEVRFGSLKVGNGSMEVRDLVDVRGAITWHTVFRIKGGIPLYRVNDSYESWFDVVTLTSRRFYQDIDEGSYERKRRYEFFTERGMYQENDKPEQPTVASPLDDGSFLYFVRTIPLEVGKEYAFSRYFNPASNPVTIKVLRRETIKVPAGTFNTVVLQPTFKTKGIFSENGKAEVWITDDDRRMMVQMKSKLSIGSLNLYLRGSSK
jgi:hypothetical protein